MRKSTLGLYAPFIALALVQALFVALLPSRSEQAAAPAAFQPGQVQTGGGFTTPSTVVNPDGSITTFDPLGNPTTASPTGGTTGVTTGGSTTGSPVSGGATAAAGDISHCKNGRQHDVTYHAPKCMPKFVGANGGATYAGVTEKEIKVVFFFAKPNDQVDAVLARQGLAATREERDAFIAAFVDFIHKHYELYGRKISYEIIEGNCPTSPPQDAVCKEEARAITKKKPFAVVWNTGLYPPVFDEFARAGIVSFGGQHFDEAQFRDRRPYRYDVWMGGDRSAAIIGDYYCKKLAGKNATHSGPVIHSSIGGRGAVARKLGIIVVERPENVASAKRVADAVKKCGGGESAIITYESDIVRAQEQASATVTALIQAKVTTVVCMCDAIAPSFNTVNMSGQNYFPEHMLSGMGFIDYDVVGRLYDPAQWAHAFGPSQLPMPLPFDQSDAAKVWRATGRQGRPCSSCGSPGAVYGLLGTALMLAGPTLTPTNLEKGVLGIGKRGGWAETKGRGDIVLLAFGPDDYTGLEDAREVYWSSSQTSVVDGQPGAYIGVDNGRRYEIGTFSAEFKIPVPSR